MIFYQVGETVRLNATITDSSGNLSDPSTVRIKVNKPDGTEAVPSSDMTRSDVGLYYYDYVIPNDLGKYRWNVTAIGSSDRITIVKNLFDVDVAI